MTTGTSVRTAVPKASLPMMMNTVQKATRWSAALILACLLQGCGATLDNSRGRYERILEREVVSKRPKGEKPVASFEVTDHRLMLKIAYNRTCEQQVREDYEVSEQVEHTAPPQWWIVPLVGVASTILGGMLLENAPNLPTQGVDSDGKQENPRATAYALGAIFTSIGVAAMFDVPRVGVRNHVRESNTRTVSESVPCGERPYTGPVTIARAGRTVVTQTNTSGRSVVDVASLSTGDPTSAIMLEVEELNLQKSLDLTTSDLAELGIR